MGVRRNHGGIGLKPRFPQEVFQIRHQHRHPEQGAHGGADGFQIVQIAAAPAQNDAGQAHGVGAPEDGPNVSGVLQIPQGQVTAVTVYFNHVFPFVKPFAKGIHPLGGLGLGNFTLHSAGNLKDPGAFFQHGGQLPVGFEALGGDKNLLHLDPAAQGLPQQLDPLNGKQPAFLPLFPGGGDFCVFLHPAVVPGFDFFHLVPHFWPQVQRLFPAKPLHLRRVFWPKTANAPGILHTGGVTFSKL